jgi:hypothetical protein
MRAVRRHGRQTSVDALAGHVVAQHDEERFGPSEFHGPAWMRARDLGAGAYLWLKINRPLIDQSMISRAGRHGFDVSKRSTALASWRRCVGVGHDTRLPSDRALE